LIVIFCDNIEDFIHFLDRRVMNEVFYEFKETQGQSDLSSRVNIEVVIHFLAKTENSLILYETKQSIVKSSTSDSNTEVITGLEKVFQNLDPAISLIKGKIREIYLSYSP
jgi:hypothetical protein